MMQKYQSTIDDAGRQLELKDFTTTIERFRTVQMMESYHIILKDDVGKQLELKDFY